MPIFVARARKLRGAERVETRCEVAPRAPACQHAGPPPTLIRP